MKARLTKSKLLGAMKTTTPEAAPGANAETTTIQRDSRLTKRAIIEAEGKKAKAITIIERYTRIR